MFNLTNKANKDILGTIEYTAVTIVGTPSYTSGNHIWNGAAPILNKIATIKKIKPNIKVLGLSV